MTPSLGNTDSADEYGSIDDEDLLLAESRPNTVNAKRSRPSDFYDDKPYKTPRSTEDPKALVLAKRILKKTWGFTDFRLKQQAAITRLIEGHSAVVIFPTGGGKSLVYQVPALAFDEYDKLCGRETGGGVTLVVSPLIALMKVGLTSK